MNPNPLKILVFYYSQNGSTRNPARRITRGIDSVEGCEAVLRTVPKVSAVCEAVKKDIPDSGSRPDRRRKQYRLRTRQTLGGTRRQVGIRRVFRRHGVQMPSERVCLYNPRLYCPTSRFANLPRYQN